VADGAHAAAKFPAEFTNAFLAIPFGDVCLFGIRFDADVDILPSKVLLDGFCNLVAELGG